MWEKRRKRERLCLGKAVFGFSDVGAAIWLFYSLLCWTINSAYDKFKVIRCKKSLVLCSEELFVEIMDVNMRVSCYCYPASLESSDM